MESKNTSLLVGTLQSVLSGKGEVDFRGEMEALGFSDDSEFNCFLDGCQQLVKIGEK